MKRSALLALILILIAGVVYAAEQARTTENAEVVGKKICPVSGEKIDEKVKETYEYKGKIYNFCCPMCVEGFKKDPEKYIEKMEKAEESKGLDGHEKHHDHNHND